MVDTISPQPTFGLARKQFSNELSFMDKTISSESVIDPLTYSLDSKYFGGSTKFKLDLLPWILSQIIWHLAKSRSQGPSTLLCMSQVYHCRTTISRFTYHQCLYKFCLTCVVQLCTYLKIQQSLTSCTVLPLTLLQETIFFKTHRS